MAFGGNIVANLIRLSEPLELPPHETAFLKANNYINIRLVH